MAPENKEVREMQPLGERFLTTRINTPTNVFTENKNQLTTR